MTDTNQASELYELCKDVYKRTGWEDTRDFYHEKDTFDEETQTFKRNGIFSIVERKRADYNTPLYTSDYLLEKLPKTLERPNDAYGALWGNPNLTLLDDGLWEASYRYEDEMNHPDFCYVNEHFTPLKALLKLTIALSEAGELK